MDLLEKFKNVEDIQTATLYNYEQKQILILTEDSNMHNCDTKLVDFLKSITKKLSGTVEIFLHLPYHQKRNKIYQAWLENFWSVREYSHGLKALYKDFKYCLPENRYGKSSFLRSDCPFGQPTKYSRVKVHVVDITKQDPTKIKNKYVQEYLNNLNDIKYFDDKNRSLLEGNNIWVILNYTLTTLKFTKFMLDSYTNLRESIFNHLKIDKQLDKIENRYTAQLLHFWGFKKYDEKIQELKKNYDNLNISKLISILIEISAIFTDVYTIARVLGSNNTKTVIICTTGIHARHLNEILGDNIIEKISKPAGDHCIDLVKIMSILFLNKSLKNKLLQDLSEMQNQLL